VKFLAIIEIAKGVINIINRAFNAPKSGRVSRNFADDEREKLDVQRKRAKRRVDEILKRK